ncbi:methyl-accepting chemotaxis protein [Lachnoclostridium pacaense]|uniref:methyl-accepting chemotaxis protein n=1 Tax=Enterocloster hominis (ex Hitch et al. 2024) TaxID=1917870 RepID=UPI001D11B40D|nr:methyl-accepting chemotaxis protein [Lachnoclostridium pacaense]MCC2878860.1 methyl-accepting chemotaxis protein [Lachnoclostridium pacaense]
MKRVWSSLKINKKLLIAFLLVTILSSSSGFISLFLMKKADVQYSGALTNYGFSQGDIGLLMEALTSNTFNIMTIMATDPENTQLIRQSEDDINKNAAAISQCMANIEPTLVGEERSFYETIEENLPLFTQHAQEVITLAKQNKDKEAMDLYQDEALEHIEKIQEAVTSLMDSNRMEGSRLSKELTRQSNLTVVCMALLSVAAFCVSMILATFIARAISRPMEQCSERLVGLSQGDLQTSVPVVDSEDETGILADATKELVDRLKSVIEQLASILGSIADGNLDIPYTQDFSGDFAALHTSSSKIIDSLNEAFHMIDQSAGQVDSGAEQVSMGAQALSQGATEQASSIEELAATINDISSQVNKIAENAQKARKESERQGANLDESSRKMQDMVSAMDQISSKSGEIGKIIKTIEDIAFQTNILALNAAVEAARAGEAGKGFAVVADEVRNLAGKSADAAKNTTGLIEETIQAVENGTEIAALTADALKEVVESSHHVAGLVDLIAEASNTQAVSISQVTQGVDQISSVVQTNSATAQESAAASEELAGQSRMMKDLIGRFKLKRQ